MNDHPASELTLPIEGMTCASCVNRIERFLRRVPGVETASVNLATETAPIRYRTAMADRDTFVGAIEAAGYDVRSLPTDQPGAPIRTIAEELAASDVDHAREARGTLIKALASLAVAAVIMVLMYAPGASLDVTTVGRLALLPATVIQVWAGGRFYRAAWRAAQHGTANMDTLVAVGTTAAWAYSVLVTLLPGPFTSAGIEPVAYFDSSTIIIGLVLLGRWLEARAKARTGGAIRRLVGLSPATARVVRDGVDEEVALEHVRPGDLLRVRPGDTVPVDGVVVEGSSAVDASMLTGEPIPVPVGPTDPVIGASRNTTGTFVMRATRVGRDTALARIVELVARAQGSKAPIQRLADRVAEVFVPIVLVTAAATFVVWFVAGPEPRLPFALTAFISVLVIACPCAMGLATPTAIMVGTGRGAEAGILIRGGDALETAHRIDAIVFDKTGTLTEGRPTVLEITAAANHTVTEILSVAASLERGSEHPLGAAIVSKAQEEGLPLEEVSGFRAIAGGGLEGTITGAAGARTVLIGNRRLMEDHRVALAAANDAAVQVQEAAAAAEIAGQTVAWVAIDGIVAGLISLGDPVKRASTAAVRSLSRSGIEVWLVTGDSRATAEAVGRQVGIPSVRIEAEARPADKAATIERLQARGLVVAMVGDGINDAPAIARADLGIAIGTGADIAIEASDVTLMGGDPRAVAAAIELSRATMTVIRQNLVWAFGYNIVLIPIAMGALYPAFGLALSPALAAGAMALSSVSVVINSLRLRGFEGRRPVHSGDAPAPAV
jgi:Cu+-exporting ATPase